MAVTVTRTKTDMIGTPASPATIAATASSSATDLDHTIPAGVVDATIGVTLIAGTSAPTTAVTIQFYFSQDGTNFIQDGGTISLTMSASTTYYYHYDPPDASQKSRVVVTNGATNAITCWCQGNTLAVS